MQQSTPVIFFWQRGLPGVLCIGLGVALAIVFRHSSPWPETLKSLLVVVALGLALGGAPLVSSYVHQLSWRAMRPQLLGLATLAAGLLSWQVGSWLMTL